MRLEDYLVENNERPAAFAERIECKRLAVYRYCLPASHRECRIPNRAAMIAIYVATEGAVCPNDFYELPELPGDAGAEAREAAANGAAAAP